MRWAIRGLALIFRRRPRNNATILKRAAIIAAGHEGKSVVQVKKSVPHSTGVEDETATLLREKRRIERTVETLTSRLEAINQRLIARGGDDGGGDDDEGEFLLRGDTR
jgi:hypothetical protein